MQTYSENKFKVLESLHLFDRNSNIILRQDKTSGKLLHVVAPYLKYFIRGVSGSKPDDSNIRQAVHCRKRTSRKQDRSNWIC